VKEYIFVNSTLKNTVPYCQKYTPTDCFLDDFAHRVVLLTLVTTRLFESVINPSLFVR